MTPPGHASPSRPGLPRGGLRRPSPAVALALFAVVVALCQPVYAAAQQLQRNSVGSKQIKNNSVRSVDLKAGAVTSASVRDGAITGADLAPGVVESVQVGSWTHRVAFVDAIGSTQGTATTLGSLSSGTGLLQTPAATLVVNGRVLAQGSGGTTRAVRCRVVVDGAPQDPVANTFTSSEAAFPVSASVPVPAGLHDVALACWGSGTAGQVQVTVLAVPR